MRSRRRLLSALAVPAAALALAACGGDDGGSTPGPTPSDAFIPNVPQQASDDDNRFSGNSSVGEGVDTANAAEVDPAVTRAAEAAGCEARGFTSAGRGHGARDQTYTFSTNPPTSGTHYTIWADWGIYDQPVPYAVQTHNLEHGGIVVSIGRQVPAALREELGRWWAASPPYLILTPDDGEKFPPRGVVVTSWQRWLVCKPFTEAAMRAVTVFRDTYRGTGPEPVNGLDAGVENDFPGMPTPLVPDLGARRGE